MGKVSGLALPLEELFGKLKFLDSASGSAVKGSNINIIILLQSVALLRAQYSIIESFGNN